MVPLVSAAGQAPSPASAAAPVKTAGEDKSGPAVKRPGEASSTRPAIESLALKQREATLAAMQKSVDKQRASVAASVASADKKSDPAGKPAAAVAEAPFFNLPPLPAPENLPPAFAMPEATIADVDCVAVPEAQVTPVVEEAAHREGLEARLLQAVIEQESGFRPCAVSKRGAQGLMQLMPDTAEHFGVKDPFDVKQNIDAGAKFLKELITRYGGDLSLALGAYNAGSGKVDAAGGIPPIAETSNYVSEILKKIGSPPAPPKVATQ
jgi:soluble lytic murein transglycosylase-like protein